MNRLKSLLILTLCTLVLAACSSVTVNEDYDSGTDFSKLKTFTWHHTERADPATVNYLGGDIFVQRLAEAVKSSLTEKGFTFVKSGADFMVNYDVITEERQDVRTYNTYGGYAPGYGGGYGGYGYSGMHGGMGSSQTTVTDYTQGTLVLDVIHPGNDTLLWRGTADGRLPKKSDASKREENMREVVDSIFKNFPPEAAK
ncbi:MAG: DUF4136 domain-containing protein [Pseudomonadales bacterium]